MRADFGPDLVLSATIVFLLCALVLRGVVGLRWALVLAFVRVALPVLNFGGLGPLDAGMVDDLAYTSKARGMLAAGIGPLRVLTDPDCSLVLFTAAGGRHVGYLFMNLVAQTLFGPHYWSAVLVNVFLSCLAARGLHRLVRIQGADRRHAGGLAFFFLLHWDVLAWSSFFNLKDTLVLTLSVWTLAWMTQVAVSRRLGSMAMAAGCMLLTVFVRWYVPVILLGAFAVFGILQLRGRARVLLLGLCAGGLLLLLQRGLGLEYLVPSTFATGLVRFPLTPVPWQIDDDYSFLLFPAVLHWFFLPIAGIGALRLWRRSPLARLVLIYLVVIVAFYALVPRLQGPRHRFQAAFGLALCQFEGLTVLLGTTIARPRSIARGRGSGCAV